METGAELYRRLAAECLTLIEHATDEVAARLFLEMAATWQRLVERAENGDCVAARQEHIPPAAHPDS